MMKSSRQVHRSFQPRRPSRPRAAAHPGLSPPPPIVPKALLAGTYSFLIEAGCSRLAMSEEIARLQKDARPGLTVRRLMAQGMRLLAGISRLMRQWCQELPYVHRETGTPRGLRFDGGEPCLLSLLARHFPGMPAREALLCLEEQGAVVRLADGSYAPVPRWHGDSPRSLSELVTLRACRYLAAGLHNMRAGDSTQSYFDRATATVRLPLRLLPEFRRQSELQLRYVVDTLDSWLLDAEAQDDSEPCVLVGVHCYVHAQPETPASEEPRRHK